MEACRSNSRRHQMESLSNQARISHKCLPPRPTMALRSNNSRGLPNETVAQDSTIKRLIIVCKRSLRANEIVPVRRYLLDRTRYYTRKLQQMQTSNQPQMRSTSISGFKISCVTRAMTKRATMDFGHQRMNFSVHLSTQPRVVLQLLT